MIFVDTSAFYALLDRDDEVHEQARTAWAELLSGPENPGLLTSNYVLVESFALVQGRLGMDAVQAFNDSVLPVVGISWVTTDDHAAAVQAVLAARRRHLSLVDCTSFQIMRRLGVVTALAFDRHFPEQGFETLP